MTPKTTEKKTDKETTAIQKEQTGTNRFSDWTSAIQNSIDVPRAIHREIC